MIETFDAEAGLLALMLRRGVRQEAALGVDPKWFSSLERSQAFEVAIRWRVGRHEATREMTAVDWAHALSRRKEVPFFACCATIAGYLEHSGAPENLTAYREIMLESWQRRQLHAASIELGDESANPASDPQQIASEFGELRNLVVRDSSSEEWSCDDPALDRTSRTISGVVSTGFIDLDRKLWAGGLAPGELIVVAGRPGMGKTAFALDLSRSAATDGVPVRIMTLESDPSALNKRLTDLPTAGWEPPRLWRPRQPASVDEIARQVDRWAAQKIGLLVIDHLHGPLLDRQGKDSYEALGAAVRRIGAFAAMGFPVVLCCQLSRGLERRDSKIPDLPDLRDTGAIEEAAHLILMLHRPAYYDPSADHREAIVHVAKQREGEARVMVRLAWVASPPHFEQWRDLDGTR